MNQPPDWQQLLRVALLGTRQSGEPVPALPDLPAAEGREAQVLQTAGTLALMRKAGFEAPAANSAAPAAAPPEVLPALGPTGRDLLHQMLAGHYPNLLPGYLGQLDYHGRRVPHRMLVALFDYAAGRPELHNPVAAVAGARGAWLANLNEQWHPFAAGAAAPTPDQWETGTLKLRLRYLKARRHQDADAARALLAATLPNEAAKQQAQLLSALAINLSTADAELLETYRQSKSKDVRQAAAALLARIEGNQLEEELWQHTSHYLTLTSSAGPAIKLEVKLPETWQPEWLSVGIEPKDGRFVGEKTAWLGQMLALLPPRLWAEHWQLQPPRLLKLAAESEWAALLLTAWAQAIELHRDADWALALLKLALTHEKAVPFPWSLLGIASPAVVSELLLEQLPADSRLTHPGSRAFDVLLQLPDAWPPALTDRILNLVQNTLTPTTQPTNYQVLYQLERLLNQLALAADVTHYAALASRFQALIDDFPDFQRYFRRTLDTLYFRRQLADSLHEPPLTTE